MKFVVQGLRYLLRRRQAVRKPVRNEAEVAKIKWGNPLPKVAKGKKKAKGRS